VKSESSGENEKKAMGNIPIFLILLSQKATHNTYIGGFLIFLQLK